MAIPESQLETWSHQGSKAQSAATYATIRGALEAGEAAYADKNYDVFLQGSYGNDTNIYADSDVDVVIRLDSTYYDNSSDLPAEDQAAYKANFSAANYSYANFKADVAAQLAKKFGASVKPGKKAILVEGNGTRRDADVLPAALYRKYTRYKSAWDNRYEEGIVFWASDGTEIVNYPKQHSDNCTAKHQNTSGRFKPTVRVLKNMRNAMIAKGYIQEGVAPSYFLEGMLYNVPNGQFGLSHESRIVNSLNWVIKSNRAELVCANEMYYLLNPASPVTWRAERLQEFLDAAAKFWDEW